MYCTVCKTFHDTVLNLEKCGLLIQSDPVTNSFPRVVDLVIRDIQDRSAKGYITYGTFLQPFNGRDSLLDAYAEVLDLAMYIRQKIEEENLENVKGVVPALNLEGKENSKQDFSLKGDYSHDK